MATLGKIVVLLGFVYPVTQGLPVEPQTSTLDGKGLEERDARRGLNAPGSPDFGHRADTWQVDGAEWKQIVTAHSPPAAGRRR